MSTARIAKLETTLLRGLDPSRQNPEHDGRFLELLGEYERLVDRERGTCCRRDRWEVAIGTDDLIFEVELLDAREAPPVQGELGAMPGRRWV